jgi:hypothetical protein
LAIKVTLALARASTVAASREASASVPGAHRAVCALLAGLSYTCGGPEVYLAAGHRGKGVRHECRGR